MFSTFDYEAQVAYIRDATGTHGPGEYTERRLARLSHAG
jgi:hypothetical protein